MKNYIKILSILFTFAFCIINAQVSDTLIYVKTFETNKVNYIGHPLSKLLNDMTMLQPKSIWSFGYYSGLNFCEKDKSNDTGEVNMIIYWQTPIPFSQSDYYEDLNHFYFTNNERNFYGSKIVKDIYVFVMD